MSKDTPMMAADKACFIAFLHAALPPFMCSVAYRVDREDEMQKNSGKKKEKCKNCEGKGLIKNGDKKMKCQRCGGTGFKS
jgi:ribosomal protein S27AE